MNWCGKWIITCTSQYVASPHRAGGVGRMNKQGLLLWLTLSVWGRNCFLSGSCSLISEVTKYILNLTWKKKKTIPRPFSPNSSIPYASGYTQTVCSVRGIFLIVILIAIAFTLTSWHSVGTFSLHKVTEGWGNGVSFSLYVFQNDSSHG